jgi:hypothetical protein
MPSEEIHLWIKASL